MTSRPRPPQRSAEQRGNALFVVLLAISLLTAVGMYSMRAASLANQAIGFNRQSIQTGYIADFAARAVAAELVGNEQHYFQYISQGADDCRANRDLAALTAPNRPPCYKLQTSEVWQRVVARFPSNVGTDTAPTLLGTLSQAGVEGAFIVEMTDLARAGSPIAGEDVGADQFKHMQVLVSATGQVRPTVAGLATDVCNESLSITSGLSNLRAQVTFGPVN
jgi:Tfp pilus assembly protein PilX